MTLEEKRTARNTNREAYDELNKLIINISKEIGLDEENVAKRITSAEKSEYGAINGLINLLAAITNWPAEQGDGAMVATNRQILKDKFKIDYMLIDDIRSTRGYHTFLTDDLELVAGTEPQYQDYSEWCELLLEDLGVKSSRATINKAQWARREASAVELAKIKQESLQQELENHKQWMDLKA